MPTTVTTVEPEYIRPAQVKARYGLSRSYLYELLAEGRIKSRVIRRHGNVKGARLVSVESIRAFIESQPDDLHVVEGAE